MRLRPLPHSDTVIIRCDAEDPRSAGGLVVPEGYKWEPTTGTVLAVGAGTWGRRIRTKDARWAFAPQSEGSFFPTQCSPGDRVVWDKYHGTKIEADGETLMAIPDAFILGIMEG